MYIDTESPVPNIPSKSRDLADENNFFLTEWKWFETTVLLEQVYGGALKNTHELTKICKCISKI